MITNHRPLHPRGTRDTAGLRRPAPRRPRVRRLAVITTDKSGFNVGISHDLAGGFS
jgi:hypothetical protein